jgi:diguanylate cyclase (GGDEF)-like protein
MLSIKKAIDKAGEDDQRYQTVLGCYLAAISGIAEQVVEVTPELTSDYRLSIRALHRELCESAGIEALVQSRATLIHALEDYRIKAAVCLSKKEEDLRAMLISLAEAAETLSEHNDRHSDRLKTFTQHLQIVARGDDLYGMRRELTKAVADLNVARDAISHDNSSLVEGMHKQLAAFQKRLERTEELAAKDFVTGLLNRGAGESRLTAQLEGGDPFSVLLVDLDNFKQINDRFGHASGDQVLKSVAHTIAHRVRPFDTVCRWGGDEFLVIIAGDEMVAKQRAVQLCESLTFRCKLVILGEMYDAEVSASVGVSQACAGDTVDNLLARADSDLYRHKRERKDHPLPTAS